jgi:histidinol phosphatase-like PHP family hydrolase
MQRRIFIKRAGITAGVISSFPSTFTGLFADKTSFPFIDLHVHRADGFGMEQIMKIANERNVTFGIVEHPAPWAIKNDTDLKKYIDELRNYPVYIGLQPLTPGWTKSFSPELVKQLDYVLMDPQTIPIGKGEYQRIYELQTYVKDTDFFMKRYMEYSLQILNKEPIQIFAWPLFLPVCIARDYYKLWTDDRMQQLISAAKKKDIAFEINDMSHTPHEKFINMAKEQGLKFTFGSDSRNNNAGRLAYAASVAKKCNLRKSDFFIPTRKLSM